MLTVSFPPRAPVPCVAVVALPIAGLPAAAEELARAGVVVDDGLLPVGAVVAWAA